MIDLINFYRVKDLEKTRTFYKKLGFSLYKDQGKCLIYDTGHGKLGFCSHFPEEATASCITFVYGSEEEVNKVYEQVKMYAEEEPLLNSYFKIYHFFIKDPNGLKLEFQYFCE